MCGASTTRLASGSCCRMIGGKADARAVRERRRPLVVPWPRLPPGSWLTRTGVVPSGIWHGISVPRASAAAPRSRARRGESCQMDDALLRERARSAIREGKLPAGAPHRTWGGPGSGVPCVVCELPVSRDGMGFRSSLSRAEMLRRWTSTTCTRAATPRGKWSGRDWRRPPVSARPKARSSGPLTRTRVEEETGHGGITELPHREVRRQGKAHAAGSPPPARHQPQDHALRMPDVRAGDPEAGRLVSQPGR
jgi:hypothetical protein